MHSCWFHRPKKAFDTVDCKILLKMEMVNYGINGTEMEGFLSCFKSRRHFYRVNGEDSETRNIELGVPQGSFLRSLLFLHSYLSRIEATASIKLNFECGFYLPYFL